MNNKKEIHKLVQEIYNITVVLNYFCKNQKHIEELYNISPIIGYLLMKSDMVNTIFINDKENEKW
jgi:hypothetical protein